MLWRAAMAAYLARFCLLCWCWLLPAVLLAPRRPRTPRERVCHRNVGQHVLAGVEDLQIRSQPGCPPAGR